MARPRPTARSYQPHLVTSELCVPPGKLLPVRNTTLPRRVADTAGAFAVAANPSAYAEHATGRSVARSAACLGVEQSRKEKNDSFVLE